MKKLAVRAYEVVAMIIPLLLSDTYLYVVITCPTCSFEEVLWKKLARFIEFISSSLYISHVYVSHFSEGQSRRT